VLYWIPLFVNLIQIYVEIHDAKVKNIAPMI